MTDIVFVQPPVNLEEVYSGLAETASVSPPFHLLLLSAITREKGFKTCLLDCPGMRLRTDESVKKIVALNPKIVGLTAMTPHIYQAANLAKKLKESMPNVTILLGGVHVTAVPEETMQKYGVFDIGVLGEAEITIINLLKSILNKEDLNEVKGIVFRENGSTLKFTGEPDRIKNMDDLPYYAWDMLEGFPERYGPALFAYHKTPFAAIIISRGCNAKCIFCYSGSHIGLRSYSAEYTFKMIKYLMGKYGIKELSIYDDNFVMYRKHLFNFCNKLIEAKLDFSWSCNARIDLVNEDILSIMKKAGCWQISYGIESGSQKIINLLNKNVTLQQIQKIIRLTNKIGIRTVGFFMIGNFEETKETIGETIRYSRKIGLDDFRMSFFTPLPGSSAYNEAERYGYFEKNWKRMTVFQPVFVPKGLTKDALVKYQKLAIRKFFFRPKIFFSYAKMVRKPDLVLKGAKALVKYIFN